MKARYSWLVLFIFTIGLFSVFNIVQASFIDTLINLFVSVRKPILAQDSFQFYVPIESLTPTDPWSPGSELDLAANTNINSEAQFPPLYGKNIRLRLGIKNTGVDLPEGNRTVKLQFAKLTSGSCSSISSWTDLGSSGSAVDWRGGSASGVVNGTYLPSNLLPGATAQWSYQDQNPSIASPFIGNGQIVEMDWSIQNNIVSPDGLPYCFRIVKSDNTVLDSYTRYPQIRVPINQAVQQSGTIDRNTGGSVEADNSNGSKLTLEVPPNYSASSLEFNITSYDYSSYIDSIGSTPAGKSAANSYIYRLTANDADSIPSASFSQALTITIHFTDSEVSGINRSTLKIYRFDGTSWSALPTTLNLGANNVSADISSFSSFSLFGDPAPTPTPAPSSGNSGGGGGGGGAGGGAVGLPTLAPSTVDFSGFAYPGAIVTVLKDGQFSHQTMAADGTGAFNLEVSGISGGNYNFSFWAQDSQERRSLTFTFQLLVADNSTTKISNIIIPPTISLDKDSVAPGGKITITGFSTPNRHVSIIVASTPKEYINPVKITGEYSYQLDTSKLEIGLHTAKSKTQIIPIEQESIFSQLMAFGVGQALPKTPTASNADLNHDGKVNLIDFSIMAYWWKRSLPAGSVVDLNNDGKLDLKDFSILAYHWTG